MSVVLLGDGTKTSSIAMVASPLAIKDPSPATPMFDDDDNVIERVGDGGYDYIYKAGVTRAELSFSWKMLPYFGNAIGAGIHDLNRVWFYFGRRHWLWLQPPELDATAKALRTNDTTNSNTAFIHDAALTFSEARNYPGKWIVWISAPASPPTRLVDNTGKMGRIITSYSEGSLELDRNFNILPNDTFYIGYPVRFKSGYRPVRVGNLADRYNLDLSFKVILL